MKDLKQTSRRYKNFFSLKNSDEDKQNGLSNFTDPDEKKQTPLPCDKNSISFYHFTSEKEETLFARGKKIIGKENFSLVKIVL